jgi:hypothetical protein
LVIIILEIIDIEELSLIFRNIEIHYAVEPAITPEPPAPAPPAITPYCISPAIA